jgi:CheY-like chemotaxis protein
MIPLRPTVFLGATLTTTLLAVDDSKTMRKVIEITFSGEDIRLVLCGSAQDALSKLSERPSVALVDAGLEGTSGYELCRQLKAAQPGLSVVILSSKQVPYDRSLGSQVGADDFADKPFDTQQLIDKVSALAKKAPGAVAPAPAPAPAAAPAHVSRSTTLQYGSSPVPGGIPPAPMTTAPAVAAPPAMTASRQTAPGLAAGPAFTSRAPTQLGAAVPPELRTAAPTPPTAPLSPAVSRALAASPAATNGADFASKLGSLGLTQQQVEGVLSLSREVLERVVWEVVPTLAETMILEEIQRLTKE